VYSHPLLLLLLVSQAALETLADAREGSWPEA
jgi:hypothetical protein